MDVGTLRDRQKQQTRHAIVHAAFALFAEQGFDRVAVESICERAGVSRATFFKHFAQKELLLRELASSRLEMIRTIVGEWAGGRRRPSMADIVKLFLRISEQNASLAGNSKRLVVEMVLREATQGALLAIKREAVTVIAHAVAGIERRRGVPPEDAAETLFAIYMATTLQWMLDESAGPERLLADMRTRLEVAVRGIV